MPGPSRILTTLPITLALAGTGVVVGWVVDVGREVAVGRGVGNFGGLMGLAVGVGDEIARCTDVGLARRIVGVTVGSFGVGRSLVGLAVSGVRVAVEVMSRVAEGRSVAKGAEGEQAVRPSISDNANAKRNGLLVETFRSIITQYRLSALR